MWLFFSLLLSVILYIAVLYYLAARKPPTRDIVTYVTERLKTEPAFEVICCNECKDELRKMNIAMYLGVNGISVGRCWQDISSLNRRDAKEKFYERKV